jgi:hypothetical protein
MLKCGKSSEEDAGLGSFFLYVKREGDAQESTTS